MCMLVELCVCEDVSAELSCRVWWKKMHIALKMYFRKSELKKQMSTINSIISAQHLNVKCVYSTQRTELSLSIIV